MSLVQGMAPVSGPTFGAAVAPAVSLPTTCSVLPTSRLQVWPCVPRYLVARPAAMLSRAQVRWDAPIWHVVGKYDYTMSHPIGFLLSMGST